MTRRPIFGFGWVGALAGVALLTLLWAWYRGIDIRYHLMEMILRLGGIEAVYVFVTHGLAAHFFAAHSAIFSLITLCVVLPGLYLDPRPGFRWRAALVAAWSIAAPVLWFVHSSGRLGIGPALGPNARLAAAAALTTVLSVGALWIVTRSRLVCGVALAAAAIGLSLETPIAALPFVGGYANPVIWNALIGGSVLFVAIRRRGRVIDPDACTTCGYDLRGLATRACPECGRDNTTPPAEPALA